MAIRDRIVARLDNKTTVEVVANAAGGSVEADHVDGFFHLTEKSRSGKVKNWKTVSAAHVISVEFESG